MGKINVLSLCDGISTGQLALREAGIEYDYYLASEIDKHCIKVTQHNFPATIQLGNIYNVDVNKIPFKIDLLLSSTPCQGFSFAGKQLKFDDPRSQLFFQFCKIYRQLKKKNPGIIFLFENVRMDKKSESVISNMLNVYPHKIDSTLVCAQTRKRNYWTTIKGIEQPEDRGIILQDILQDDVDEKYYLSETALAKINKDAVLKQLAILKLNKEKSRVIISSIGRTTDREFLQHNQGQLVEVVAKINSSQDGKDFAVLGKAQCLSAGHNNYPKVAIANNTTIVTHNMMPRSSKSGTGGTGQVTRTDGKAYCLDTGQTNVIQVIQLNDSKESGGIQPYQQNISYSVDGKMPTLLAELSGRFNIAIIDKQGNLKANQDKAGCITGGGHSGGNHSDMDVVVQLHPYKTAIGVDNSNGIMRRVYDDKALNLDANYYKGIDTHAARTFVIDTDLIIRRLTPIECCRLQGLPDTYFYKNGIQLISDSQIYKAVGNGWQRDTITHLFSYLK